jgi:hypothetical protein
VISDEAKGKLRRLMEAREKRDEAKKAAEESEKDYREIEAEVYDDLEESGLTGTVKIDLGQPWGIVSFNTRETYFGRIIDADEALDYFDQRAMTEEVSAPKFVMKRINEEVRDRIEQGLKMPPGIDYFARRGVTITRQKD